MKIHSTLRIKILLWFAGVSLLLGLALYWGYRDLGAQIWNSAQQRGEDKLYQVREELLTANALYLEMVQAAMKVLKDRGQALGPASIRGEATVTGRNVPAIFLGDQPMANWFGLVDQVKSLMGGTATIFVKSGDDFVRVCTNVQRTDGSRAVGTVLDPNGKAIAAIRQGRPFYGVVDILGRSYLTGYEPIFDASGRTIGIWYVGYLVGTLARVGDGIQKTKILEQGYLALIDPKKQVVFHSQHVLEDQVKSALDKWQAAGRPSTLREGDWNVRVSPFRDWDYLIVSATYLPDVARQTWSRVFSVFGLMTLIILGILILSFNFARRLSESLIHAEQLQEEAAKAREVAEEARNNAEAARESAEQANRTKSAFLANMSHELRTPMNAIIGYSEILMEDAADMGNDDYLPDLKKIHDAAKHLLGLINDVLDLSKIEAGKMTIYTESFDIKSTIDTVVSTIRPLVEKKSNKLEVTCPADIGTMTSDVTKVRQTLFNLLSNASKFTENGSVKLSVSRESELGGDWIVIKVTDSGIGMTKEQMGKLFQAFSQADASTTRKFGGTGLGLAISRRFCQMLGGDISVESEYGKGSTFTVRLPGETAGNRETAMIARPADTAEQPNRPNTVLVIDDDPAVHDLLQRHLAKEGFTVRTASGGKEGLELAKKIQPSVITLDVMMPGMDGWAVLSALKADPAVANIPVVMLTISDQKDLGFTLGAVDYFTKPIDRERLATVIGRYRSTSGSGKILVVEDDPVTQNLLVTNLQKSGWQVKTAGNGKEALAQVEEDLPSLILLDLMMPEMDGFEFLTQFRMKREHQKIPVIVLTAKDLTADDNKRLAGQVADVLQKGAYSRDALLQEIRNLMPI